MQRPLTPIESHLCPPSSSSSRINCLVVMKALAVLKGGVQKFCKGSEVKASLEDVSRTWHDVAILLIVWKVISGILIWTNLDNYCLVLRNHVLAFVRQLWPSKSLETLRKIFILKRTTSVQIHELFQFFPMDFSMFPGVFGGMARIRC